MKVIQGKPHGMRLLGRPSHRWEIYRLIQNTVFIAHSENVNCFEMAPDNLQWRTFVLLVMTLGLDLRTHLWLQVQWTSLRKSLQPRRATGVRIAENAFPGVSYWCSIGVSTRENGHTRAPTVGDNSRSAAIGARTKSYMSPPAGPNTPAPAVGRRS